MPDARPFIAAIRDAPDDDVPRLVFADWLEERGDSARAEFIRVQCELARLPTADPRYPDLHVRQLAMLAEHEAKWLGEWTERLVRWEFRRGLLHAVTIQPAEFVVYGGELFNEHPVERVAPVNEHGESLPAEDVARVVAAPAMQYVRALEVAGCRRDEPVCGMYGGTIHTNAWLNALADARHVRRLEELRLNGDTRNGRGPIAREYWQDFCTAPHLATLRRIDLSNVYGQALGEVPKDVVRALGNATFTPQLRYLSLAHLQIDDECARLLASAPLVNLEELDLGNCGRTPAGLGALMSAPSLARLMSLAVPCAANLARLRLPAQLQALHLVGNITGPLPADGWEALFQSLPLQNLKQLSVIAHSNIPPAAMAGLLQAVANLEALRLGCENLSLEHLAPLFAHPVTGPTALTRLSLPDCDGIGQALGRWPGLAGITELNLTRMHFQDAENDTGALLHSPYLSARLLGIDLTAGCRSFANVKQLAKCAALTGLRWLGFGLNGLNPEKMTALMDSPHLRNVEALHLYSEWEDNERAVVEALRYLAQNPWPRLREVVVGSGTVEEGIEVLRAAFGPRLRVWADC